MTILSNPAKDELLGADERDYARDAIHAYGEIVRKGEAVFSQFCEGRGVPEDVCMRAMIQTALHRAGTNSAHLLAMFKADDLLAAMEAQQLADRLKDALNKQLPLSRETNERLETPETRRG